jgi:glycosyltransferase involved in cell wall biosynthesis
MKILELCPYSSSACGVWARVKQESIELSKRGHQVKIFSSNVEKGTNKTISENDSIEGIEIKRFKSQKLGGESFMLWNFEKEAIEFKPDVIIAHNYRHIHTTKCLKIAKQLKCKVFLVTHAPFVEGNITRSRISSIIVNSYDKFVGPRILNQFDKILTISHWEVPYLIKCGALKSKITYLPNGIPEVFFTEERITSEENKILFLGRIAPIKSIETIIKCLNHLKDKTITLELVGPAEKEYKDKLLDLIKKEKVGKRVKFSEPIYNLKEKINKIDSCKYFVLPSVREGMSQSMIESMARGKRFIGSNIPSITDIIINGQNGFVFPQGNEIELAKLIDKISKQNYYFIRINAKESVIQFSWNRLIDKLEEIIKC